MRRLPSLRGIQAFEAVARLGSLSAAADSLGITGSAVSHRIRGLESELGVHLLRRTPRGLILTDAGRRYRGAVEDAFAGLTQEIGRAHVELQSLMRISYAVFCLKKKKKPITNKYTATTIIIRNNYA